ncbi:MULTISPECIES: hypothetical protein [Campylobacter]|uniref:Bro-N domain-containing protein n=1 Tax=Campylobacter vicugnae TaxID=1660076 RepID=A0ABZ2E784_9BACT|nr:MULTISPECIES: hypothetical protein [unclassified Campylobacter]MCR8690585.1 hypothetical protein [Campylobacter sp. RM9264]MCR8701506.1 hypothetical protein [Campylobacter sp. RM12176]
MQTLTLQKLFTTAQVASNYGITQDTIRDHKKDHSDEIIENLHFIVDKNDKNRPLIKWTLRGIIKLGMFIRSPQAKAFRLWAEQELEKSINDELEKARLTRLKSIEQTNRIANLEAIQISQAKHHQSVVNGYKAQLTKQGKKIELLKTKLTIAKNEAKSLSNDEELLKKLEWLFKRALADGVIYAINSSRDKIINDALKRASDEFMSNLHLLKNQ